MVNTFLSGCRAVPYGLSNVAVSNVFIYDAVFLSALADSFHTFRFMKFEVTMCYECDEAIRKTKASVADGKPAVCIIPSSYISLIHAETGIMIIVIDDKSGTRVKQYARSEHMNMIIPSSASDIIDRFFRRRRKPSSSG